MEYICLGTVGIVALPTILFVLLKALEMIIWPKSSGDWITDA